MDEILYYRDIELHWSTYYIYIYIAAHNNSLFYYCNTNINNSAKSMQAIDKKVAFFIVADNFNIISTSNMPIYIKMILII